MSRTGDRWDNAVEESFFSTLKTELVERRWFPSRASANRSIAEHIDTFL